MRFKNTSGDRLDLPSLGLSADPGEIVEIEGEPAKGLLGSPDWERTDTPARKAAAKAVTTSEEK